MPFTVSRLTFASNYIDDNANVVQSNTSSPLRSSPISERIFHVGKYLELQFEFKTSELNGVLLSVAEPFGFPALSIEMHNGKVSFTSK